MGRSVSAPRGAIVKCYVDVSDMTEEFQWDDFIEDITARAQARWSSLTPCAMWLDSEDLAILENDFCYIGVSEYCGLACIWLVSKEDEYDSYYYEDIRKANLSTRWCEQISLNFEREFGELVRVGGFSDGTSIYERKEVA